jgi:hypothetical protein
VAYLNLQTQGRIWSLLYLVLISLLRENKITYKDSVNQQLRRLGLRFRFFGRSEIKELVSILHPNETIVQVVYGFYPGGSGLLVLTEERLLLIDKRSFFIYTENISFGHVQNLIFERRYLQGTLRLYTASKELIFKSISDARLRDIEVYINEKVSTLDRPMIASLRQFNEVDSHGYSNKHRVWQTRHVAFLPRPRPSKFQGK